VRTVRNTHRLDSGQEYRIGRDERADIPLIDARVSWEHAVLRTEGRVWVLEDRGSRNGTFLGSERIMRLEISKPYVVHFGHPEDGPVLRFELSAPEVQQAAGGGRAAPASQSDTTFMPGVLREPTSRVRIQKIMKIGRRPDNDIVVSDLGVSKQHAELRLSPTGKYQILDLGSHNGTFVNGNRINQAEL
jgi:pSer/pThr/pTyr-binding forkhead associated (FHA) protein